MKNYLGALTLILLMASCNTKPDLQYENGWHKAFIKTMNGHMDGAMVDTDNGLIDSICFSSGKCTGHFTQWTTFEHSQNVSGTDNDDIYEVYIIPDEWDQTKELFEKKEDRGNEDFR